MANLFNRNQNTAAVDDEPWTPLGFGEPESKIQSLSNMPAMPEPPLAPAAEEAASTPDPVNTSTSKNPKQEKPKKEKPKKDEPSKKKVGRPKKNDASEERKVTTISYPAAIYDKLSVLSFFKKSPMSDIVSSLVSDMIDNTYECDSAACNKQFVMRIGIDEETPKPMSCPCCGGTIRRINHLKGVSF